MSRDTKLRYNEVARDPTSRMPFKRRARYPNNRMFLRVLNVNLDHYDFPSNFIERLRFVTSSGILH